VSQKACVLGLGLMGSRAALRLTEKGQHVVAWNRTVLPPGNKIASVATLAPSPSEAVKNASAVLLFLHNADAVFETLLSSGASVSGGTKGAENGALLEATYAGDITPAKTT